MARGAPAWGGSGGVSTSDERTGLGARARASLALVLACVLGAGLSAAAVATAPKPSAASGWIYYRSPSCLTQTTVFTLHATRDPKTGACENGGRSSGRVWSPGQPGETNAEVEIAFNPRAPDG